jgi:hypothetical protein
MTVRTARNKRSRLANRRRLAAARPAEGALPLMIVKADGTLAPVLRPADAEAPKA